MGALVAPSPHQRLPCGDSLVAAICRGRQLARGIKHVAEQAQKGSASRRAGARGVTRCAGKLTKALNVGLCAGGVPQVALVLGRAGRAGRCLLIPNFFCEDLDTDQKNGKAGGTWADLSEQVRYGDGDLVMYLQTVSEVKKRFNRLLQIF